MSGVAKPVAPYRNAKEKKAEFNLKYKHSDTHEDGNNAPFLAVYPWQKAKHRFVVITSI